MEVRDEITEDDKNQEIKVLMIEDDVELAEMLSEYLTKFKIQITNIDEPYLGLSTLNVGKFDLVILDLTLPGIDGLEVCKEIRKRYSIPIIISSARHDITDKVNTLESGADDYLPKPYPPRELEARIRSILRRAKRAQNALDNDAKMKKSDIDIEENKMEAYHKGHRMQLTNAEFGILNYLIKKKGKVVSREELIYNIEAINEESTNKSIDVIIGRIRHKLGESSRNPQYIKSVRGFGYKFIKY